MISYKIMLPQTSFWNAIILEIRASKYNLEETLHSIAVFLKLQNYYSTELQGSLGHTVLSLEIFQTLECGRYIKMRLGDVDTIPWASPKGNIKDHMEADPSPTDTLTIWHQEEPPLLFCSSCRLLISVYWQPEK